MKAQHAINFTIVAALAVLIVLVLQNRSVSKKILKNLPQNVLMSDSGSITSIVTYDFVTLPDVEGHVDPTISAGDAIPKGKMIVEIYECPKGGPDLDGQPIISVTSDANGNMQVSDMPCDYYYVIQKREDGAEVWRGRVWLCPGETAKIPPDRM